jgi:hypothetical protein
MPDLWEYSQRGKQLWILDNVSGINSRMLLALRALDNRARGNRSVVCTREQIARFWLASVATVQRALDELEQASLIRVERIVQAGRGQSASRYYISWANLRDLCPEDAEPKPGLQIATPGDAPCNTGGCNLSKPGAQNATPNNIPRKNYRKWKSIEDGVLEKQESDASRSQAPTEEPAPVAEQAPLAEQTPPAGAAGAKPGTGWPLRGLVREDFYEPQRMEDIYLKLWQAGWVSGAEVERQQLYGLMIYCRRQKPPVKRIRLFVSLVRGTVNDKFGDGDWRKRPTDEDLQTAAKIIHRLDWGEPLPRENESYV